LRHFHVHVCVHIAVRLRVGCTSFLLLGALRFFSLLRNRRFGLLFACGFLFGSLFVCRRCNTRRWSGRRLRRRRHRRLDHGVIPILKSEEREHTTHKQQQRSSGSHPRQHASAF